MRLCSKTSRAGATWWTPCTRVLCLPPAPTTPSCLPRCLQLPVSDASIPSFASASLCMPALASLSTETVHCCVVQATCACGEVLTLVLFLIPVLLMALSMV